MWASRYVAAVFAAALVILAVFVSNWMMGPRKLLLPNVITPLPTPLRTPLRTPLLTRPPKKTLVLDLDHTLIFASEDPSTGKLTIRQRPQLAEFLARAGQMFGEVVVFTAGTGEYAKLVVSIVDPNRAVISRVFSREDCVLINGMYVKDLRLVVGEDVRRTVIIDDLTTSYMLQPHNGIQIRPWTGEEDDRELEALLIRLERVADPSVTDVRELVL